MARRFLVAVTALVLAVPAAARAADAPPVPAAPPPAARPLPPLATTPEARAAIAKFKEAFKGRDVAKKADAVDTLGRVNHPFVVDELMKLTRQKEEEIRAAAYMNLGEQRAIPAVAGAKLAATADPKSTDWEHLTSVVDAIEALNWRGGLPVLLSLLKHDNQIVVRWALNAIGDMKDVRAVDAVVALIKELKVEEGVKWDGVEVRVDTGTAGDADQKAAEAQGKALLAAKAGKGKSAARKMRSAGEILYEVLKDLTGEMFGSGKAAREWVEKHKADLDAKKAALDAEQAAQEAAGKAAVAAAKAGK